MGNLPPLRRVFHTSFNLTITYVKLNHSLVKKARLQKQIERIKRRNTKDVQWLTTPKPGTLRTHNLEWMFHMLHHYQFTRSQKKIKPRRRAFKNQNHYPDSKTTVRDVIISSNLREFTTYNPLVVNPWRSHIVFISFPWTMLTIKEMLGCPFSLYDFQKTLNRQIKNILLGTLVTSQRW